MSSEKTPNANSVKNDSPYEEEFRAIGELLQRDAEPIMKRWFKRAVEEQVHATQNERRNAMNHLLEMLQSIGRRLEEQSTNAIDAATDIARHHGCQRSGLGWDITHVVRDYEILHGVTLEHLGKAFSERLTYRQAITIASVMDEASGSAVQAFSEMTNRKLDSQLKRQQAELRQLVLDLTDAEHGERQRIARALHDDFQQILVAARMRLHSIIRDPSPEPAALQEMQALLDQVLETSRDLSRDLHPQVIETENLLSSLKWLSKQFHERHKLKVNLDLQVPEKANPEPLALRRLLYDGVRELLFNIVKHGQTDQAWLRVSEKEGWNWKFEVEDRGVGFSPVKTDMPAAPTGLGLTSLQRRIEQVGGKVEVDSEPGQGTRIAFVVPMKAETDGDGEAFREGIGSKPQRGS